MPTQRECSRRSYGVSVCAIGFGGLLSVVLHGQLWTKTGAAGGCGDFAIPRWDGKFVGRARWSSWPARQSVLTGEEARHRVAGRVEGGRRVVG